MEGRGEVVVMSIVVARVILSLSSSGLLYEASGLIFLSLAALFVETSASQSSLQHFNLRLGTSSGIYLGALTIPVVLAARFTQHLRSLFTLDDLADCGNFRSEFWSAFSCCAGLLIFLSHSLHQHKDSKYATARKEGNFTVFTSTTYWGTLAFIIPCVVILFPIKLLSTILYVIGCTTLFQYQLHVFPACASLGEAMLVASGLAIYIGNAAAYTFGKSYTCFGSKDTIAAILQGTLIGLLCVPQLFNALGMAFSWLLGFVYSRVIKATDTSQVLCKAAAFYVSLILALTVLTTGWLHFVHGLQENIVLWVIQFVLKEPQRLVLCGYWVAVLCTSVLPFYIAKSTKVEQIMVRKFFHLMVVFMFIPALLLQQDFLRLAFCVAFAGFLVVEMIRVWKIPPLGEMVYSFMKAFTDNRDSDILIISHFSLLLGCALPLWLTELHNDRPLAPFAGVLSLGIGDTMASVIGYNYGRLRLSSSSKKTVEGTAAGIVSMLMACLALHLLFMTLSLSASQWISLITAVICTGLMEAYTMQLDNAFIPLIFFALLSL